MCRLRTLVTPSGAGCCHVWPSTSCSEVTLTYSYYCQGLCPEDQVCKATATGNRVVNRIIACQGGCDPITCVTTTEYIEYGDVPTECDCLGER